MRSRGRGLRFHRWAGILKHGAFWRLSVARHAGTGLLLGLGLAAAFLWVECLWAESRLLLDAEMRWRTAAQIGLFAFLAYAGLAIFAVLGRERVIQRLGRARVERAAELFPGALPATLAGRDPAHFPVFCLASVALILLLALVPGHMRAVNWWVWNGGVNLPPAAHGWECRGCCGVVIGVTSRKSQGRQGYVVHGKSRSPEELDKLVAREAIRVPDPTGAADLSGLSVRIRADAFASWGQVSRLLEICRRHGVWRVSFGVAPMPREGLRIE